MTIMITAVLTTRNRAHLLPAVLAGLEAQTIAPQRYEIVAIDDGSIDDTPGVLAQWSSRLPLRVQRQKHAGLANAKNLGVLMARGPVVVFLDDDDVASPSLLAAHLAAHIRHPERPVAVLGHTRLSSAVESRPVMRHVTRVGCQLFSYGWMQPGQWLKHTEFWGGRSSCKRSLLVNHGLFRPEFSFGCEDIELGWRLARHGLQVVYEPKAQATMIRSLSFDEFCARSYRQGRSQYLFSQMHPQPDVRDYCEIDAAMANWPRQRMDYAARLRWTRQMDRIAIVRSEAGLPDHPVFQKALDEAYREAFALSRAKGVHDMSIEWRTRRTTPFEGGFRSLPEWGLPAESPASQA
ncbi:glycosyltransferase family 2 protein [Variovorax sp. OV329]|uniref:glycosyltransferase family 2 protein n=1 Tax=Variovorax sp. OV329 TaxID=1882825 RepID=UPI0008E94BFD|nr:glycosyltransferase [Variovorax sp. OV329]SFM72073.1 Glycosyltransferase, GT2 family [Variovorax sp. OV329]